MFKMPGPTKNRQKKAEDCIHLIAEDTLLAGLFGAMTIQPAMICLHDYLTQTF
jgi:hypothetical protein